MILTAGSLAYGHGVTYGVADENAIAVHFAYAGGEPMSYAEAKVFGPDSSDDLEFQNGRTDARGLFAFVPDCPGTWRLEAWDNLGHKANMQVNVEQKDLGLKAESHTEGAENGPSVFKILLGFSLIANVAFAAVFIRKAKN